MTIISFSEFKKLNIRIGKVEAVKRVEGTKKLLLVTLDFGREKRETIAGMAAHLSEEDLQGKLVPVIMNLEPTTIRGIKSEGMILAADFRGKPVLLTPEEEVPLGTKVR